MIDKNTISRIMDAVNIVDVVSDFVTLRKAGVNYKGLCPFHNEKTPSFVVSPSKSVCKCFSCGKGGNAVHFVMDYEQLTYPEALRYLAKKYNIEIQERELSNEEKQAQSERESLFVVNQWACNYFQQVLFDHPDGRAIGLAYFRSRGFRDDTIKKFQLGYCLQSRDAMNQQALKEGYKADYIEKTGLCYKTDQGLLRDRYHGRVIFPVHTLSGKVVAFGGRVLQSDGKIAKYVNSPESDIYHKSNELYGIYFAKQAIVKQNRCFLVEGYTDVISMHQSGIENVVASSGTSLTSGQIRLLHRFTENITILYDGDIAGIKASLRGIDMLLEEGLNIKILLLPDGDDPDSFARKHNATEYGDYIDKNQVDFLRFKTNLLYEECGGDPTKKSELIKSIVKSISVIPNAILRSLYIKDCSQMMGVKELLLINEVNELKKNSDYNQQKSTHVPVAQTSEASSLLGTEKKDDLLTNVSKEKEYEEELQLINMMIKYGEVVIGNMLDENEQPYTVTTIEYIVNDLRTDDIEFKNPLYKKIVKEAIEHIHDTHFIAREYFLQHQDQQISLLAAQILSDRYQLSKYHTKGKEHLSQEERHTELVQRLSDLIPHIIIDLKLSIVEDELKETLNLLSSPEFMKDEAKYMEEMMKYKELKDIEQILAKQSGERVISAL
ncbi:MAG: DNA primase [Bacteroidaceae bacterium]